MGLVLVSTGEKVLPKQNSHEITPRQNSNSVHHHRLRVGDATLPPLTASAARVRIPRRMRVCTHAPASQKGEPRRRRLCSQPPSPRTLSCPLVCQRERFVSAHTSVACSPSVGQVIAQELNAHELIREPSVAELVSEVVSEIAPVSHQHLIFRFGRAMLDEPYVEAP